MEFIQHTISWCRGDIVHGVLAGAFGLAVATISILSRVMGTTTYAKALFLPMLVVGTLYVASGIGLVVTSQARIEKFQDEYERAPAEFVEAEEARMELFIRRTRTTLYALGGAIVIGLAFFYLWNTALGRSIGLGLVLIGFSAMFSDHFSEERARAYYRHILDSRGQLSRE